METNELKAEVDKFLKKLQQSIVKPTGDLPTPKIGKPEPAKFKITEADKSVVPAIKASDFVKGKPNVLKPEFLKAAKECPIKPSQGSDPPQTEGVKPPWKVLLEKAVEEGLKDNQVFSEAEPKGLALTCPQCGYHWKEFQHGIPNHLALPQLCPNCGSQLEIEGKPMPSDDFLKALTKASDELLEMSQGEDEKLVTELEGFYEELLKVVNLLVDTVEYPPAGILLYLKNGKYEKSETYLLAHPDSKAEEAPAVPFSFPDKIQVELSLGKDLVDVLLEMTEDLKQFIKQKDEGIIS